jgi:hypothetical protein
MADDMLARLEAIDPAVLADVVRQDQRSAAFEITGWSVRRLSDKGVINPDGLWVYSGYGQDAAGPRPWSVVVKIFNRPDNEPPASDLWFWKREFLVAQSRLTDRLPGPVVGPRFYRADESPEGAWIWMEQVEDHRPGRWTLDDYAFAARQIGRWNGACLAQGQPADEPWLARQHYRSFLGWVDQEAAWRFPLNLKHISPENRVRQERLWAEKEEYFQVLDNLPLSFSHLDCFRRNLLIRPGPDRADELVVIDWAQCGLGPLGAELSNLGGMSGIMLEWPPERVRELDAAVFESYLAGLRELGWTGDSDVVRLGYMAWLGGLLGSAIAGGLASWCSPEGRPNALRTFGIAEEELYLRQLPMFEYALDCADEARGLMKKLGVS